MPEQPTVEKADSNGNAEPEAAKRTRSEGSGEAEEQVEPHKKLRKATEEPESESEAVCEDNTEAGDESTGEQHMKSNGESCDAAEAQPQKPAAGDAPKTAFGERPPFVAAKPFGAAGFGAKKDGARGGASGSASPPGAGAQGSGDAKPFSFGSGLAFGSGFKVLKADAKSGSSIFDKKDGTASPLPESTAASAASEASDAVDSDAREASICLQKQVTQTGEEAEDSLYQANVKLYQLVSITEGWKERGVGPVHVNKDRATGRARLVMRSRGLLKVILNLPLVKGFSIQKGFPGSLQSEKFIRILAADSSKGPVQYALKTAAPPVAEQLYKTIADLIPDK
ncbi:AaceriADL060Wp [[Ashbya] aceris (nom. inval.)]|nr:AaceriADL060Wp [[Ashbya] aceris (nom. inval.)]